MINSLKISIITINFNNVQGLKKTVESVINQTFQDFEYIIIDGESTDGSKEYIEQHSDKLSYWVSEKDGGVYEAMNKGIKQAKGDYCLFLNSGDWLLDSTILSNVYNMGFDKDIVFGDLQTQKGVWKYPDSLSLMNFFKTSIGHPATFIRRELFYSIGYYREDYKIVSDWIFFIESIIINAVNYKHIRIPITFFDTQGISNNANYHQLIEKEREVFLNERFPRIIKDYYRLQQIESEVSLYKKSRILKSVIKIQSLSFFKFLQKRS